MTHNASHIIIGSGRSTVSFGDPAKPANPTFLRVWHVAAALVLVGFLAGLAL